MAGEIVTGQFSDSYFPIMDGVAITISNYLLELPRILGPTYAVVPYIPGDAASPSTCTYRYYSLPLIVKPPYRIGLPQIDWSLHRALREQRFDLLHAHTPFYTGRYAVGLARQRGIPVVATFHSRYRDDLESLIPFTRMVDRAVKTLTAFYSSVDQVWVPTLSAKEILIDYGYRGPVEIVGNGIDLQPADDLRGKREEGNRILGTETHEAVLLYVGQLDWKKNLALLLESLSLLKKRGYRFKMAFVGEGSAAGSIKAMAKRLGIAGNTIFAGVLRNRSTLSACYARADCFVFPSLYETCGLVVKEAAAFGIPSVLIEGSAAAEEIVDGFNGFVTEDSVRAYAEKLALLLSRPRLLVHAGDNARRTLYRTWREAVQEVGDRYLCLIRGASPVVVHNTFPGGAGKEVYG